MSTTDQIQAATAVLALLALGMSGWALRYSYRAARAAERANELATPGVGDGQVRWLLERSGRGLLLRNVGTAAAHDVRVDAEGLAPSRGANLPEGVTLHPGQAHHIVVVSGMVPNPATAVPVLWDDRTEPVYVPIPPAPATPL